MSKIILFNFLTANGFFKGPGGDLSWHVHGKEEGEYAKENSQQGGILLFGRVTYEMMSSYWPSPMAAENDPVVADGMNKAEKIVFSNTLHYADWNNTRIMSGDIISQITKLKNTSSRDMAILGSGSIATQFADAGLIDEYQLMIDPVLLGEGGPAFQGLKNRVNLRLNDSKVFSSGVVLLTYVPK